MSRFVSSDYPLRQSHTFLLATDSKNSVLAEILDGKTSPIAYCVYGEQSGQQEISGRLGFNGELREARMGWYLLGNGYRAYNPMLMRFHSPDSLSPFGKGGLNAYVYCVGDPVNYSDPTGHMPKNFLNFLTRKPRRALTAAPSTSSLSPLIKPDTPSAARRPLPALPESVNESTALSSLLDESTGEPIFQTLPSRRTWAPQSSTPLPKEMMTYEQMAQLERASESGSTSRLASQSPSAPYVDRSTKPKISRPSQRLRLLTPDESNAVFTIDHVGDERVDLAMFNKYLRR
jgi:RHS repeat-associated protein